MSDAQNLIDHEANYVVQINDGMADEWIYKRYYDATLDYVESDVINTYGWEIDGKPRQLKSGVMACIRMIHFRFQKPDSESPLVSEYDTKDHGWIRYDQRRRAMVIIYREHKVDETGKNGPCASCQARVEVLGISSSKIGRATIQRSYPSDKDAWICASCFIEEWIV